MKRICQTTVLILALLTLYPRAQGQSVPTPSAFLKMKIGADGVLATYEQIVSYIKAVDPLSDRITVQDLGPTTMGYPYIVAIVTSPGNQKRLDYYRDINNRLYDPRRTSDEEARKLIAEGKTIVAIQMSIHSTEVGAAQMSMELLHRFATENTPRMRAVLDDTIVVVSPAHNPDGTQLVAEWNRKTVGTKFEGSNVPFLYHKYVGHDDNRDWYMFTQKESRISVGKIWNYWHPQISYDLHQMGGTAARIFMPPYVDPYDPNVDPILRAQINSLGSAMAADLIGKGRDGVVIHAMYDMWTPARAYVNYHGGVRMLTEVASARLASPITLTFDQLGRGIGYDAKQVAWNFPRPWRGGTWRLRDIMDYEHDAADALLDHAVKYREQWLTNFYRVNKNAIGRRDPESGRPKPYAIITPANQKDPASAATMLEAIQYGDVEIRRARKSFTADGRQFPSGSYVILMDQPASSFAKTLTEVQHYPDLRQYPGGPPQRPYDVTAYTLPLLMGVETLHIQSAFEADLERVTTQLAIPSGTASAVQAKRAYAFAHTNGGIMAMMRLLKNGVRVQWTRDRLSAGGRDFAPGTILVPVAGQRNAHAAVNAVAKELPIEPVAIDDALPAALTVTMPRVGLYKSFVASMDEGWTRWIFEQWGLGYTTLENKDVRAGNLRARFDAILLPDQGARQIVDGHRPGSLPDEYVGGLGEEGVQALRAFVEAGGTLVALDSATELPISRFGLPVKNVLSGLSGGEGEEGGPSTSSGQAPSTSSGQAGGRAGRGGGSGAQTPTAAPEVPSALGRRDALGPSSAAFYAPGSIVRTEVDITHPVAYGSDPQGIAWFEQSPAFDLSGNARAIVTYPAQGSLLLSGWLLGGERLNGKTAVAEVPLGKGRVVLFGFRPQYRAQTWATFPLLFNALFYSTATESAPTSDARVQ